MSKRTRSVPFEVPDTLRIRGRMWRVVRERDLGESRADRDSLRALSTTTLGITLRDVREIQLSSRHRDRRALAATFLHEVLHACSRQRVHHRTEERFVSDVEYALLDALSQLSWSPPVRKRAARRR